MLLQLKPCVYSFLNVYQIKQGVEEVQAEVLQKDPRLSRALIPVDLLHITLLVTHLSTQEQIDTYVHLINACRRLHVCARVHRTLSSHNK